jgi:hypothetical protein
VLGRSGKKVCFILFRPSPTSYAVEDKSMLLSRIPAAGIRALHPGEAILLTLPLKFPAEESGSGPHRGISRLHWFDNGRGCFMSTPWAPFPYRTKPPSRGETPKRLQTSSETPVAWEHTPAQTWTAEEGQEVWPSPSPPSTL